MDSGQNANGGNARGGFSQFGNDGDFGTGANNGASGNIGGGDVMIGSGAKKSRKWLVVLIVILVFAAVGGGVFALWKGGVFGGSKDNDVAKNTSFHVMLEDNMASLLNVVSFVDYMYSGEATMNDFILSDNEYEEQIRSLNDGLTSMTTILNRLNEGPELSGINAEIDLRENYDGLKLSLTNDIGEYEAFINLTARIYQAFRNQGQDLLLESFAEYDSNVSAFINKAKEYFSSMQMLKGKFAENNCAKSDADICASVRLEIMELQSGISESDSMIPRLYASNIGEINYGAEGSVMYYVNNLRIATGVDDGK